MNLVSNFVGSISPSMFGNSAQTISQDIDLKDNTFSDMLEKQIQKNIEQEKPNFIESLGLPDGLNISEFDGTIPQFSIKNIKQIDNIAPINEIEKTELSNFKNAKDMSTSEVLTFFNSLFESKPTLTDTARTGLFDFERKVAASSYGKYARNIVTDLSEFVSDALKLS